MAVLYIIAKRLPEQIKIRFEDWHETNFTTKDTENTQGMGFLTFALSSS